MLKKSRVDGKRQGGLFEHFRFADVGKPILLKQLAGRRVTA
jgi:hypothetical protein